MTEGESPHPLQGRVSYVWARSSFRPCIPPSVKLFLSPSHYFVRSKLGPTTAHNVLHHSLWTVGPMLRWGVFFPIANRSMGNPFCPWTVFGFGDTISTPHAILLAFVQSILLPQCIAILEKISILEPTDPIRSATDIPKCASQILL